MKIVELAVVIAAAAALVLWRAVGMYNQKLDKKNLN